MLLGSTLGLYRRLLTPVLTSLKLKIKIIIVIIISNPCWVGCGLWAVGLYQKPHTASVRAILYTITSVDPSNSSLHLLIQAFGIFASPAVTSSRLLSLLSYPKHCPQLSLNHPVSVCHLCFAGALVDSGS